MKNPNHLLFLLALTLVIYSCSSKKSADSSHREQISLHYYFSEDTSISGQEPIYYYPDADRRLNDSDLKAVYSIFHGYGEDSVKVYLDELFKEKYPKIRKRNYQIYTKIGQSTDRLLYHINGFDILHRTNPDSVILEMRCDSLHQLIVVSLQSGDEFSGTMRVGAVEKAFKRKLGPDSPKTFEYQTSYAVPVFFSDTCEYIQCDIPSTNLIAVQ